MTERRSHTKQWQFYERRTGAAKERARERLKILGQIEALVDAGMSKSNAVNGIARATGTSASTIWNWFAAVQGVSRHDRLAYLVPGFRGGGQPAEVDEALYRAAVRDYLRPDQPSWAACIRRLREQAAARGVALPRARTLWRRLHRDYSRAEIAMLRGAHMPAWLCARLPANDR